ncbi:hypothetical protein KAR91_30510 [Candidatus Pacearchaeota archaeon]|nr:hypothetical protein [Candidatus Pacearchaeota archaeon]
MEIVVREKAGVTVMDLSGRLAGQAEAGGEQVRKDVWSIHELIKRQGDMASVFTNEYQNVPFDFVNRGDGILERPCGCRHITQRGRRIELIYRCQDCDNRHARIERAQRDRVKRGRG